jgi:cytochrome c oxidase cbb3-type subunit 3
MSTFKTLTGRASLTLLAVAATAQLSGQAPAQAPPQPPPQPSRGAAPAGGGARQDYPVRPPADPAIVERGRALYGVHCAFCHGPEARGGDGGGPNLLRSELVLNDQNGELVAPVVQNGRPPGMPKVDLTTAEISDIATFIHSFRVGGYDVSRSRPPSIVVGDAAAGVNVFKSKCSSCHSTDGDLKGFGAKFTEARQLQQTWLMPPLPGRGGAPPAGTPVLNVPFATVTVTLPSGQKIDGRLVRIDDFIVSLLQDDGTPRSFHRQGDVPKVDIHDPLEAHRRLLPTYTDKEIHDLTAYLVTVK